jgi:hypothetical protein
LGEPQRLSFRSRPAAFQGEIDLAARIAEVVPVSNDKFCTALKLPGGHKTGE